MPTTPSRGAAAIGQSGGPTAVINQSLAGVVEGLRGQDAVTRVLGMRRGVSGLTQGQFVDLGAVPPDTLERLARTPSSALQSTRDKPTPESCQQILKACRDNDIRFFFYIGGNDSADTCRIVSELARDSGYGMRCFHVPKTVDNDLMQNDHTPGYPSAARFVATAFMSDALDNYSLPGIKINIVMGRHAGFLTAASALARRRDDDGPHLVYVPEVAFDVDRFIADVQEVFGRLGRCQVAVSEGIRDASGHEIGAGLIGGEKDPHGNVQLSGSGALGDQLANLVKARVKTSSGKAPRVRADTFGYLQRCWPDPSPVDAREAREVGRVAAQAAVRAEADASVAIVRTGNAPYAIETRLVPLREVAAKTRTMPPEFLDGHRNVSRAFLDYLRPLVGDLPAMERLPG